MARWVTYPEAADEVDALPLMHELADDVVKVAKGIAAGYQDTGRTRDSIHQEDVDENTVSVVMDPEHPDEDPSDASYGGYVELGTSDTPKHPTLKPALYIYRGGPS